MRLATLLRAALRPGIHGDRTLSRLRSRFGAWASEEAELRPAEDLPLVLLRGGGGWHAEAAPPPPPAMPVFEGLRLPAEDLPGRRCDCADEAARVERSAVFAARATAFWLGTLMPPPRRPRRRPRRPSVDSSSRWMPRRFWRDMPTEAATTICFFFSSACPFLIHDVSQQVAAAGGLHAADVGCCVLVLSFSAARSLSVWNHVPRDGRGGGGARHGA